MRGEHRPLARGDRPGAVVALGPDRADVHAAVMVARPLALRRLPRPGARGGGFTSWPCDRASRHPDRSGGILEALSTHQRPTRRRCRGAQATIGSAVAKRMRLEELIATRRFAKVHQVGRSALYVLKR
jgi:hypothetical protein